MGMVPNKKGVIMNIEMLVSTMNQTNYNLIHRMNIKDRAVVINQLTDNNIQIPRNLDEEKLKFINVHDKGLSKSRNMAINNSSGDICVICDDDLFYHDDYTNKIKQHMKKMQKQM